MFLYQVGHQTLRCALQTQPATSSCLVRTSLGLSNLTYRRTSNNTTVGRHRQPTFLTETWPNSVNGRDVPKRAIIDGNSIVSGWNYDILTSIIAQLLTSQPFPDLWQQLYKTQYFNVRFHIRYLLESRLSVYHKVIINRPQTTWLYEVRDNWSFY